MKITFPFIILWFLVLSSCTGSIEPQRVKEMGGEIDQWEQTLSDFNPHMDALFEDWQAMENAMQDTLRYGTAGAFARDSVMKVWHKNLNGAMRGQMKRFGKLGMALRQYAQQSRSWVMELDRSGLSLHRANSLWEQKKAAFPGFKEEMSALERKRRNLSADLEFMKAYLDTNFPPPVAEIIPENLALQVGNPPDDKIEVEFPLPHPQPAPEKPLELWHQNILDK